MEEKNIYREALEALEIEENKRKSGVSRTSCRQYIQSVMENKIPENFRRNLEEIFGEAFRFIFSEGRAVIECTYNGKKMAYRHKVKQYVLKCRNTKETLQSISQGSQARHRYNTTLTAIEGFGLGVLGVGLPDVVLFLGMLLRGIYQTAIDYGYDIQKTSEKYLILRMMEISLLEGEAFAEAHQTLSECFAHHAIDEFTLRDMSRQMRQTSATFAGDMVISKFIQGLPVVGVMGGVWNPFYYQKVVGYAQMMYQKRYLLDHMMATSNT